jgi:hypothetical protein
LIRKRIHVTTLDQTESTQAPVATATAAVPRHIREIFGEPPLLRSESRDAYDRLWSALALQFDPQEIMEWVWVRELADLTWEIVRIRRALTSLLNVTFKTGLRITLNAVMPLARTLPPEPDVLAESWYDVPAGKGKVGSTLAKYGLSADAAEGEAFVWRLEQIERMQRLIISAERRRSLTMRELQLYRETCVAKKARNEIIDAEPANLRQ